MKGLCCIIPHSNIIGTARCLFELPLVLVYSVTPFLALVSTCLRCTQPALASIIMLPGLLRYGAAAVQGFRPVMQDNFSCVPAAILHREPLGCFAVFDGHGNHGDVVSQYCADHFIGSLLGRKALKRDSKNLQSEVMAASLRKTFLKFDQQLREVVENQKSSETKVDFVFSGTTATLAVVLQKFIIIANAGDSRTLLCRSGNLQFATTDHNPGTPVEDDRIEAAGGKIHTTPSKHKVILDTEAYTNLAVSRTLGDFGFKSTPKVPAESQIVSPVPDVTVLERDHKTDEFLLLASDGVFKSLTDSDVIEFVSRQLTLTDDLARICHNLIEMSYYSVSKRGQEVNGGRRREGGEGVWEEGKERGWEIGLSI